MILVIGIVIFVAGITATAGVVAINGLSQSRQRIAFEQSLAAAEAGIDRTLGQVQWAYDSAFADYPIPAPGVAPVAACTASSVQLPPESLGSGWDEKTWAEARLDALEAAPMVSGKPACLVSTPTGDVLILKPINAEGRRDIKYGRVYARGWSPRWGHDKAVERTIKVEYVFMPYQPKHAVLTGSNLELQGSYLVDEANGVPVATAGVHTNGDLTVTRQWWGCLRPGDLQRVRADHDVLWRRGEEDHGSRPDPTGECGAHVLPGEVERGCLHRCRTLAGPLHRRDGPCVVALGALHRPGVPSRHRGLGDEREQRLESGLDCDERCGGRYLLRAPSERQEWQRQPVDQLDHSDRLSDRARLRRATAPAPATGAASTGTIMRSASRTSAICGSSPTRT